MVVHSKASKSANRRRPYFGHTKNGKQPQHRVTGVTRLARAGSKKASESVTNALVHSTAIY